MAILAGEIKVYNPAANNDTSTNGGRLTGTAKTSGASGNIFPDVSQAERTAGSVKHRKAFIKVDNSANETLFNTIVFMHKPTPADDYAVMFAATQTDQQGDILGSEQIYGVGNLNATVLSAVTQIAVQVEDAALVGMFQPGMNVRITDKPSALGAGNEEYLVINTIDSVVSDVVTMTFTTALANGYSSANTFVASGISVGDLVGSYTSFVVTSGLSGTYDDTGNPVIVDSIAGVEQNWTLTFTSATAFNCTGDTLGSLGSGTVSGDFAPNNTDFSRPYFTLASAGFGGTYQAGDTITFTTSPAAAGLWFKRTVPAGAAALSSNGFSLLINGENV